MPTTSTSVPAEGSIGTTELNIDTPGEAVITKLVVGSNMIMDSFTGADPGTGVVTISAIGGTGATILDGSVKRPHIDTVNTGFALATKVIAGTGISISSTGIDPGTGDVTVNAIPQLITPGSIGLNELNTATSGQAVITSLVAGANISISSTGIDPGTGVVTLSASIPPLGAGDVNLNSVDITTPGQALITKIAAGTNVTISSTGVDPGTGVVTVNAIGGGFGEINTASNVGSVGVGIFKQKTAADIELYKLNALSSKISIALNATDRIDIDVSEFDIDHDALLNYIPNQHRLLNDLGFSSTELWSASKIITELGLKSNSVHSHTLLSLSEKSYLSLTDTPAIPANHSDLTDDELNKHRIINDLGVGLTDLWSASKINSAIAAASGIGQVNTASNTGTAGVGIFKQKTAVDLEFYKINSQNNLLSIALNATDRIDFTVNAANIDHDSLLNYVTAEHAVLDDISVTSSSVWSASKIITELSTKASATHNHTLLGLSERSYNSLTGKPIIPANHSDLTDDEPGKHRVINDLGTAVTDIWSASKISAAIAGVSGTGEANSAVNTGSVGVGIFKQKTGLDIELYKLNPASSKVSVVLNAADRIDVDVNETNIDHNSLLNYNLSEHSVLNDLAASSSTVWSSAKIQSTINAITTGEVNTVSNTGTVGVGIFKQKVGSNNELYKLNPLSNRLTITLNAADRIDFDVSQANIDHNALLNFVAGEHRLLNDLSALSTELWSAAKISTEIALKADATHNHTLLGLSERSYNSLTDKPIIPANHSDLADDEPVKHRVINDLSVLATDLWSAFKISNEISTQISNLVAAAPGTLDTLNELAAALGNDPNFATTITNSIAGKADTVHAHLHSAITDDEPNQHRVINDIGSGLTDLWSASKITAAIAAASGTGEVNTASNTGTLGVGLFKQKSGTDLQFYKIHPVNNALSVTLNATDRIDLTINEGNINHNALSNYVSAEHRLINDFGSAITDLWSASKISTELALKSNTAHNHTLLGLSERSYNSLTNKPIIPSAHSDIVDNEPDKHRLINDAGSGFTDLWSAVQIQNTIDAGNNLTSVTVTADYTSTGEDIIYADASAGTIYITPIQDPTIIQYIVKIDNHSNKRVYIVGTVSGKTNRKLKKEFDSYALVWNSNLNMFIAV